MTKADMVKYQWSALATRLMANSKNDRPIGMVGALEKQLDQFGLNPTDRDNIMYGFNNDRSEKAKEGFLTSGAKTYQDNAGDLTMADHLVDYNTTIQNYLGAGTPECQNVTNEFNRFGTKKLKDILKEIGDASAIVENHDSFGIPATDPRVANAQTVLQQYEKIMKMYTTLESDKFEQLRPQAAKVAYKQALKQLAA